MHRKSKPKFKDAYAAFDWKGNMLTSTVRFTKEDTIKILNKLNPQVTGFEIPFYIKLISVDQDMVPQLRLFEE